MAQPDKFGQLLSEALHVIKGCEGKNIAIIEDEFGYALGREGGSAVERWRQGHLPPKVSDIEQLAQLIIKRSCHRLDRGWLKGFLHSTDYPYPDQLCDELFVTDSFLGRHVPPAMAPSLSAFTSEDIPLEKIPAPGPLPAGSRMPLASNPLFVGRAEALRAIARALRQQSTAVIYGMGGTGKTQLAVAFVHRYGCYFPGGVFWLEFAEAEAIPAQVALCGGLFGMALMPAFDDLPLENQVQQVQRAWRDPIPRLLVFDNCQEESLLVQWRPPHGGCRVLVASRRGRWDPALGVTLLPLDVFHRQESVQLLRQLRPDTRESEAKDIATELGDLPLALHLAGTFLYTYQTVVSPADYLAQLRQRTPPQLLEHPSLQGWGTSQPPTGHQRHVERTLTLSYERLDPAHETDALARMLLARTACFAPQEPIPTHLLWATLPAELPLPEKPPMKTLLIANALSRLVTLGLLQESRDRTFVRLHRLLAAFINRMQLDAAARADVEMAVLKAARHLNKRQNPGPVRVWDVHLYYLVAVAQPRQDARAADLCQALGEYLRLSGNYEDARVYFERALSIRQQILAPDDPDMASVLHGLGALLYETNNLPAAQPYLEQALRIREQGSGALRLDVADTAGLLGCLLLDAGNLPAAESYLKRALSIHEEASGPNHPQTALSLSRLGALYRARGAAALAQFYSQRAQTIRDHLLETDLPRTATSLVTLGAILKEMGKLTEARPLLEQALITFQRELGPDHPHVATSLRQLGILWREAGDMEQARRYLRQAFRIRQQSLGLAHPDTVESAADLETVA